jgi:hypothetical protein
LPPGQPKRLEAFFSGLLGVSCLVFATSDGGADAHCKDLLPYTGAMPQRSVTKPLIAASGSPNLEMRARHYPAVNGSSGM